MAFILLVVIALRTRRQDGVYLKAGQALIGDFQAYAMSPRQYRTAINHLKKGQQSDQQKVKIHIKSGHQTASKRPLTIKKE